MKALYSIRELAELAGCSRTMMVTILERNGVEYVRAKERIRVPLSELRDKLGSLADSVAMVEAYRGDGE